MTVTVNAVTPPVETAEPSFESGRVLVVDDNADIQELLDMGLTGCGFQVIPASDAAEGMARFLEARPNVVLVDLLMPGMDGFELCRRLRDISDVPIIIVSALRNEGEIIRGLDAGADDYVTKPFNIGELTARLRAQLRRKRRMDTPVRSISFDNGRLVVDLEAQRVIRDRQDVHVSPTEFRLLAYMVMNAGRVIPHKELGTQVWGADAARLSPYLKIYVRRLRQKIESDAARPQFIVSRHGTGY
ncbi:MAG TPA: response regulator transcription factor, partial [Chloroflexota bacterium]|nr:response regulator transcription factor [Chloroflexota bacterium]